MIRESLYFSFDGVKSTDFPIANVQIGGGAYEESISSGKQVRETYPSHAFKPYFMGVQKNVKEFNVTFAFLEPWNDKMIDDIIHWLNVDNYKKLFFEADIDRVFHAMPVTDIGLIHNGLKQGYLTIGFRCDSAYSYSHNKSTALHDITDDDETLEIEIRNLGHYTTYPTIEIVKVGDGDVTIRNKTNGNQEARITELIDGEKVVIDCFNEEIETSLADTYRFDNFNDEYIELIYGINHIQVTGNCFIRFHYQYIYS